MTTHPNGLWIWRLSQLRPDYLDALVAVGCRRVYLKVFDDASAEMFWKFQCSPALIAAFQTRGIEVYGWGYHFDRRSRIDVGAEVAVVQEALASGLAGYVLDVEGEVKDPATHAPLSALLDGLRAGMGTRPLGYTSFGHPGKHTGVPFRLLDDKVDLAFPQIYYEKFSFGRDDEDEVQACLRAHAALGLTRPILPIWSSESDAARPASVSSLQSYLDRFPGSSIWRAPRDGEAGKAWRLEYGRAGGEVVSEPPPGEVALGDYPTVLGAEHVKAIQRALLARGFDPGPLDGDFGPLTRKAVKRFQLKSALSPDGVVGPVTWVALGGTLPASTPFASDGRGRLAAFAEAEAAKALRWTGPASEAEQYLKPLRAPMQALGHIGATPVLYDWCAAFVTYCCRGAGFAVPDRPEGFWATMALVESWKYWARRNGTWLSPEQTAPERGDIVCFEWDDGDVSLDHIGVVRGPLTGDSTFPTSEGNRGNRSGNFTDRRRHNVAGLIRLR